MLKSDYPDYIFLKETGERSKRKTPKIQQELILIGESSVFCSIRSSNATGKGESLCLRGVTKLHISS